MMSLMSFVIIILGFKSTFGVISNSTISSLKPVGYKQCTRECEKSKSCSYIMYEKDHLECTLLAGNETSTHYLQTVESNNECSGNQKKISLQSGRHVCIYSDCPLENITAHCAKMLEVGSVALYGTYWTCKTDCAVTCSGNGTWVSSSDTVCEDTVKLSTPSSGLLEIYHSGTWGTVCDDDFDSDDATVVCKSLGYNSGTAYTFGQPSSVSFYPFVPTSEIRDKIWLDDVECTGNESSLAACANIGWGSHNCVQSENVGVNCF